MFVIVWEFVVKRDRLAEFERAYAPAGDWAQLFARAKGFVETALVRDREDRTRFLTIDMWESRDAYETFRAAFDADYLALDARTEAFTESERRIGIFENIA
jgi:heme-degrading monooxygenase HmoA